MSSRNQWLIMAVVGSHDQFDKRRISIGVELLRRFLTRSFYFRNQIAAINAVAMVYLRGIQSPAWRSKKCYRSGGGWYISLMVEIEILVDWLRSTRNSSPVPKALPILLNLAIDSCKQWSCGIIVSYLLTIYRNPAISLLIQQYKVEKSSLLRRDQLVSPKWQNGDPNVVAYW